jgi:hypothetical protein
MRTAALAILLASLAAAPAAAYDPEPAAGRLQKMLLALPPAGLTDQGKAEPFVPSLKGSELQAYAVRAKGAWPVCKAVRRAQVVLWACSPEPAPEPLRAEVAAFRKQGRFDPQALTTRYAIPTDARAENRLKNEVYDNAKQLTRLAGCLEEALEALEEVQGAAASQGPRWAAQVMLMRLWVLSRLVSLEEHQAALGLLRKDQLPEHDPSKHAAWQLTPRAWLTDYAAKKRAERALSLRVKLAEDHKGTTWDRLGGKVAQAKLGAGWQAVK